ncbi:unnamed protein product, partial [Rotaria sordida]
MFFYEDSSYTNYSTSLSPSSIKSSSFSDDINLFIPYKKRLNINILDDSLPIQTRPISSSSITTTTTRNSSSLDNDIIRETILELDRIVEKDIKDLESECHRHVGHQTQSINSGHIQ